MDMFDTESGDKPLKLGLPYCQTQTCHPFFIKRVVVGYALFEFESGSNVLRFCLRGKPPHDLVASDLCNTHVITGSVAAYLYNIGHAF